MLAWGEKRQPWRGLLIDGNRAHLVQVVNLVDPDYDLSNVRDRVLSNDELQELRDIFVRMQYRFENAPDRRKAARPVVLTTQIALWVCLGALTRIGETVKARWEHVDFAERTWFIPKENVKRVRGGSRDHVVHLSDFLFDLFRLLKRRTGHSPYCFPGRPVDGAPELAMHLAPAAVSKQVGDRQVSLMERCRLARRRHDDSLVLGEGKNGNWTPHDLRRTGATIMETLGVEDKIIDLCQNHAIHTGANKVRRHYLHADNGPRMRKAWDLVSEHLIRVVGRPEGLIAVPVPRPTFSVHDVLRDVA
ncbi:MAG: site-specific integrase [Pigmentiphaga sp.]